MPSGILPPGAPVSHTLNRRCGTRLPTVGSDSPRVYPIQSARNRLRSGTPGGRPWPLGVASSISLPLDQSQLPTNSGCGTATGRIGKRLHAAQTKYCLLPKRAGMPAPCALAQPARAGNFGIQKELKRGLSERLKGASSAAPEIPEHDGKPKYRTYFGQAPGAHGFGSFCQDKSYSRQQGAKTHVTLGAATPVNTPPKTGSNNSGQR